MKKLVLVSLAVAVALPLSAQNDQSKKVKTQYLSLPSYDVSVIDPSTITMEFTMKEGAFGTEKLKDGQSTCVPKGGGLKDAVKITAYHFEIPYTEPESYLVAKSPDGTIVYAEKTSETKTAAVKFGWDDKMNQAKCEYWVADQLKKDFVQNGASFKTQAHKEFEGKVLKAAEETAKKNVYLAYDQEEFEVYGAKGKDFDYAELDAAQTKATEAYASIGKTGYNDADMAKLKEAIAVWEKELATMNKEDKKARINEAIGKGLHENCARAYMHLYDFENAIKHGRAMIALFGNFSNNRTQEMDALIVRMQLQKNAAEKNKAVLGNVASLHQKASSSKPSSVKNLNGAEFDKLRSEYSKFKGGQSTTLMTEAKKEEEAAIASGELNPYQKFYYPTAVGGAGVMITMGPSALTGIPEMKEIPQEILQFTDSKQLTILNNKIETVTPEITKLSKLEKLDLSGNQITALPEEIGQLENLETLKLSNNPIADLPASLGNCKKLTSLVIKDTKISAEKVAEIQKMLPNCKIKL
jgi:hypothetical protein